MNRQEDNLKKAFEKITPDVWDAIEKEIRAEESDMQTKRAGGLTLVQGGEDASEKSTFIAEKRKPSWLKQITAAAAAVVILVGGIAGFNGYKASKAIDSIISLDVNPSIEITMNSKDRVIDVSAANEDAEKIIGDMDFRGADIDVAMNALIGSLLRNGYISDSKNSILLSVDNSDRQKGEALREKLMEEIEVLLGQDHIDGAILSQVIEDDDEIEDLAEDYGISQGKAILIKDIMANNSKYTFEDLAGLPINELNLICGNSHVELEHVHMTGKASDQEYIGKEKAQKTALEAAGLSVSDVSKLETEMDRENGVMVYEVEFTAGNTEYEYEVNALTGEVVKAEKENSDYSSGKSSVEQEDADDDNDHDDVDDSDDDHEDDDGDDDNDDDYDGDDDDSDDDDDRDDD